MFSLTINYLVMPLLLRKTFNPKTWNVRKEFLFILYLNRQNQQSASALAQELIERPKEEENTIVLQIVPETSKSEPLEIAAPDFIFAESDNNYVTVHFEDNGETRRELIRLSIKRLAEQLSDAKEIIRCHRSYLVNKNRIKDVEGNARSLSVKLEGVEEGIPVSRSFPKAELL